MMTQGCISKSSHIRAMRFASEKSQTFIISSASISVVYRHASLSAMYCSRLGLRPSPGAAILKENFAFKTNTTKNS